MIKVIPNFITKEEEQEILSHLKPSRITAGFGRNRVHRYGSDLPYKGTVKEIPDWLQPFCERVFTEWMNLKSWPKQPDHVTINEYHKGQCIDWHIDSKESGQIITVLSIEGDAEMGVLDGDQEARHLLPARSLLHMTDEDRWIKRHCIHPVPSHRWSIVFRKGTI